MSSIIDPDFDGLDGLDLMYDDYDDARIDRWNDGALDALRGKASQMQDADYLDGYEHGLREARVVVVMPVRPEGYYHAPLGAFD